MLVDEQRPRANSRLAPKLAANGPVAPPASRTYGHSMPVTTRIDLDSGLVIHDVTGPVSLIEVVSGFDTAGGDPRFCTGMNVLWDFSGARVTGVGTADVKLLIGAIGKRLGVDDNHKVAIAASGDFVYGLARMYEAFATRLPIQLKVFRSAEDALDWLTGDEPAPPDSPDSNT